jgi:hypothetical protein
MLTPDISAIEQAVTTLTNSQRLLLPYAETLFELRLGPQPLVLDGQTLGEFDPLANYPQLADNLQNAQAHVFSFALNVSQPLNIWAVEGLPDFNDTFQAQAGELMAVINAVGEGGTPTPTQRQTVTAALAAIADGLAQGEAVVAAARQNLITFQNQLTTDHQALAESDFALSRIIPQVQQQIADDALKFVGMIFGDQLAMLVEQIGGQEIAQLTSLASVVDDVVSAGQELGLGLSAFANLVATLSAKYAAVSLEVAQAANAQFASQLQALDVQVAAQAWNQLMDFVAQSGL